MNGFWSDPVVLAWAGLGSAAMFLLTIAALPIVVAYMPDDYFARGRRERGGITWLNWLWFVAKNLLGWLLILAGILMLALPGQGLLTILVGVMLVNFPGKHRMEKWLVRRPRVLSTLNWIRRKVNRPPLVVANDMPSKPSR